MDLQTSVFLLFILFTAGHSLSCYECSRSSGPMDDSCSEQEVNTCPGEFSKCTSYTVVRQVGGITSTLKGKSCSANCHSGSQNVGFLRNVIECCDTERCNAQYAPDPRTLVPNGMKCYYCDEKSCSNILRCSASEDGCITVTPKNLKEKEVSRNSGGQPRVVKGCISKEICDSMVSGAEVISCCSGNLCNGAQSVTQSVNGAQSTQSVNGAQSTQSVNGAQSTQSVNGAQSVTCSVNGAQSVTQRANSVTQSFLFLCCSLLSFILLH